MTDENALMDDVSEEMIIQFKNPITANGKDYDSITLRVPTVAQVDTSMTKGKDNVIAISCHLISQVAGVEISVIRAMTMPDFNKANRFLQPFLA